MRIALVPLLTESVVLLSTAAAISRIPDSALRWVGIVGAVFVFYLAWRTWTTAEDDEGGGDDRPKSRGMFEAAVLAVASPNPWIFWLLIGSPVFLSEWHRGWIPGVIFLGSFLFMMLAVHAGIAALAGHGNRHLSPRWRRWLLQGTAGILVVAGGLLVWKSWTGDFRDMVTGEQIQETVDSIIGPQR